MSAAKTVLSQLQDQASSRETLVAAAESREIAALKSAIEEANASGLTSDEVSKAEEVLVQEERKLAVREARIGALEDLKAVGATS